MTQQFNSAWWSVELPADWLGEREDTCADLWSENGVGALQVSAYQRQNEAVTDSDLYDFAKDELVEGANPIFVNVGDFVGITVSLLTADKFWHKWWLRKDSLLVYITYNCDAQNRAIETATIDRILGTLKPTAHAA